MAYFPFFFFGSFFDLEPFFVPFALIDLLDLLVFDDLVPLDLVDGAVVPLRTGHSTLGFPS